MSRFVSWPSITAISFGRHIPIVAFIEFLLRRTAVHSVINCLRKTMDFHLHSVTMCSELRTAWYLQLRREFMNSIQQSKGSHHQHRSLIYLGRLRFSI